MNISENIKKYRIKNKLTQEALASIVGISAQAVSKWECGESIPDGLLLIPIADALGISLDRLCGHESVHETDTYSVIMKLINKTPKEKRFEKVREICWQTQKGLFNGFMEIDTDYTDDEMSKYSNSSAVNCDEGFTFISNRSELSFFSVFPEPSKGFGCILRYDEKYREIFEALGNSYVMQAFFLLYSKDQSYIFEKEVLSKQCNIPEDKIDDVMAKLLILRVICAEEMIINNEKKTMYFVKQRYELIAIFAMLNEFVYHANCFNLQTNNRNKALLLNKE